MQKLVLAGLLIVAALLPARAAHAAYEAPWCAIINQGSETIEEACSFRTFELCRAESDRWGPSTFCRQNPRYPGWWSTYQPPQPRKRDKRGKRQRTQ